MLTEKSSSLMHDCKLHHSNASFHTEEALSTDQLAVIVMILGSSVSVVELGFASYPGRHWPLQNVAHSRGFASREVLVVVHVFRKV